MIITPEMIATAEARGACTEALTWLRDAPRSIQELLTDKPAYANWAATFDGFVELLTDEDLEVFARTLPGAALLRAPNRLPVATFAYCVQKRPWVALESVRARARLTPEQLKYCEAQFCA